MPERDQQSAGVSHSNDPFVGRQREMAELTAALDSAVEGHGRIVMLAGEPGIGKTRLAEEIAAIAESRQAAVYWGRCHEVSAPPYWPWAEILRQMLGDLEPEELSRRVGGGAGYIAELVPDVRASLGGTPFLAINDQYLAGQGVFVLPVGELESWNKAADGRKFFTETIQLVATSSESIPELSSFMGRVCSWIKAPTTVGDSGDDTSEEDEPGET